MAFDELPMAFFADLTPHTYTRTEGLNVLNVGWLDGNRPFEVGETSLEFRDALMELCSRPILLHRGVHGCCYCRESETCVPKAAGNGQIRVSNATGTWYAAPTLIVHYVIDHDYRPPDEFLEAVLAPHAVAIEHAWWLRR